MLYDVAQMNMFYKIIPSAGTSGKADGSPISELASSSSELRRVQRLHVMRADKSGTEDGPWFLSKPNF
ncbi:hypothetical protein ACFX1Z_014590 [Malus domestica]